MKKHLLLFSGMALLAGSASAQITITSADVATPPKIVYQAIDESPSITVGAAGTSMTWNMTSLGQDVVDTLNFLPAGWVPNPNFPTSNLAVQPNSEMVYSYATNSASGLTMQGTAGQVDFGGGPENYLQTNTPSEILMNFPATYNSSFNNIFWSKTAPIYINNPPADSIRFHSGTVKTSLVDAWGSLTTPLGTFNVIRVKQTKVVNDSVDVFAFGGWNDNLQTSADSTCTYSWWANGIGFPLVEATMDSASAVLDVTWLMASPVAGINEYSVEEAFVYPNPAQNELNILFENQEPVTVTIMDITGRTMETLQLSGDRAVLNTSEYANGTYSYTIMTKENVLLKRGKFAIVK